jgi:hypothetical protein
MSFSGPKLPPCEGEAKFPDSSLDIMCWYAFASPKNKFTILLIPKHYTVRGMISDMCAKVQNYFQLGEEEENAAQQEIKEKTTRKKRQGRRTRGWEIQKDTKKISRSDGMFKCCIKDEFFSYLFLKKKRKVKKTSIKHVLFTETLFILG